MLIKKKKTIEQEEVTAIECDICGRIDENKYEDEFGEYIHIDHACGYDTIFNDGDEIILDICQHCFKKWLANTGMLKKLGYEE